VPLLSPHFIILEAQSTTARHQANRSNPTKTRLNGSTTFAFVEAPSEASNNRLTFFQD
jgi:hypothetical protein